MEQILKYKEKIILLLSILLFSYWIIIAMKVNVYDYVVVGVIYEIVWLPMLILLFALPIINLYTIFKEREKNNKLYFISLFMNLISFLIIALLNA
jgi:hypothetical protein